MDKSHEPLIKKVKALPWEKQPDYLIYSYKGKNFVYLVPISSHALTNEQLKEYLKQRKVKSVE